MLAQKVMMILMHKLGYIIAKAMALPAVKVAIAAAAKKAVFAAVIAAFFQLFAAKLGIGVGGLVLIVVAPIILALLIREWNHFPGKLGKAIASSLREEISSSFRSTTETVLNEVWDYLLSKGVGEIELELADSEEIAKAAGLARKVLTA